MKAELRQQKGFQGGKKIPRRYNASRSPVARTNEDQSTKATNNERWPLEYRRSHAKKRDCSQHGFAISMMGPLKTTNKHRTTVFTSSYQSDEPWRAREEHQEYRAPFRPMGCIRLHEGCKTVRYASRSWISTRNASNAILSRRDTTLVLLQTGLSRRVILSKSRSNKISPQRNLRSHSFRSFFCPSASRWCSVFDWLGSSRCDKRQKKLPKNGLIEDAELFAITIRYPERVRQWGCTSIDRKAAVEQCFAKSDAVLRWVFSKDSLFFF